MTVTVSTDPAGALADGSVVGRPIRLPYVMLCTEGERWCGRAWTANSRLQLAELLTDRRRHEQGCQGGLILAGMEGARRIG